MHSGICKAGNYETMILGTKYGAEKVNNLQEGRRIRDVKKVLTLLNPVSSKHKISPSVISFIFMPFKVVLNSTIMHFYFKMKL